MSTLSIIAFLSFLQAFNVPAPTIQTVSDILYASQASTTQVQATTTLQATPTGEATVTVQNPPPAPTFGAILLTMEDKSEITVEVTKVREESSDYPLGVYFLKVRVLDQNGKTTPIPKGQAPFQDVSMTYNGIIENKKIDGKQTSESTDFYHTFAFYPAQKGLQQVVFASGNLTKQVSIDVQ